MIATAGPNSLTKAKPASNTMGAMITAVTITQSRNVTRGMKSAFNIIPSGRVELVPPYELKQLQIQVGIYVKRCGPLLTGIRISTDS